MSSPRVLMVGYYGKGNFGDDVLMHITHRLLGRLLPAAAISLVVDGDGGGYVQPMLGDVTILKPGRHGHFDRIVHGGGGVFFDFASYGRGRRLLESILRCAGWRNFLALEKMLRSIFGKPRTTATRRIGLGIGVGSFAPGSWPMLSKLPILADFSALWLRDTQSIAHLERFRSVMKATLISGSDLAFLTDEWMAAPTAEKTTATRLRLGIILRDWPGTDAALLRETLRQLAQHYDLTGFIFDAQADPELQAILAPYTTHIWQPATMRIAQFSELLSAQDVLLTSRAHGAICGACLGVPSVIVAIEPKLEQVHAMLPNASILVPAQEPQRWADAVHAASAIGAATIAADVQKNRAASQAALQQIQAWLV